MKSDERVRVLYVEDNCDSFEMLKVMLELSQIEVDCAVNVDEALTRASSESFDLYLLDTRLPDGNGFSLCRTLRFFDPETPVLFYSGHAHPEEIKMGMAAGASGYITKPNSDKLAVTIIELVTACRERSAAFADFRVLAAA